MYVLGAERGHSQVLDFLELELGVTVRHQVGARKLNPGPRLRLTTDLFLMETEHWRDAGPLVVRRHRLTQDPDRHGPHADGPEANFFKP